MNDTTVIGAGREEDVRAYVTAVRAWLGDLPPEEVDDLTAGMEADLAERAAESGGTLGALLGEPEAYAAELRSAAGLPPRSTAAVSDAVPREPWSTRLSRAAHEVLDRHPWLRELRPTWWLARGAVAGWVVAWVLGTGRVVLLPVVGAALSLWLGLVLRRHEPLGTASRMALGAGNALAVVLLVPMLAAYSSGGSSHYVSDEVPGFPTEVTANGETVQNLFAYDAAGRRIESVRVFDQTGRALFVGVDSLLDGSHPDLPIRPEDGRPDVDSDVFPLTWDGHDAWVDPGYGWTPPLTLPPVTGSAAPVPDPVPSSSASPAPGASPAASASPSSSATPTATSSPPPTATPSPAP